MKSYRIDIDDGKGGVELYVVVAEEPVGAVEAGLRRYQVEHPDGSAARRCRVYTLAGEPLLDKFLGHL